MVFTGFFFFAFVLTSWLRQTIVLSSLDIFAELSLAVTYQIEWKFTIRPQFRIHRDSIYVLTSALVLYMSRRLYFTAGCTYIIVSFNYTNTYSYCLLAGLR